MLASLQLAVRPELRELPMARKQVPTARVKRRSTFKRSRAAIGRPRPARSRTNTNNDNDDFAEGELSALVVRGCLIARDAVFNVRDFLADGSRLAFLAIKDCEKELDQIERKIDDQLPEAITRVGEAKARELLACLKFITDLERIGDLAPEFQRFRGAAAGNSGAYAAFPHPTVTGFSPVGMPHNY